MNITFTINKKISNNLYKKIKKNEERKINLLTIHKILRFFHHFEWIEHKMPFFMLFPIYWILCFDSFYFSLFYPSLSVSVCICVYMCDITMSLLGIGSGMIQCSIPFHNNHPAPHPNRMCVHEVLFVWHQSRGWEFSNWLKWREIFGKCYMWMWRLSTVREEDCEWVVCMGGYMCMWQYDKAYYINEHRNNSSIFIYLSLYVSVFPGIFSAFYLYFFE